MTLDLSVGNYPTAWSEFVGQEKAKKQLQLAIKSARKRKAPLDHVLLASGHPGIGKTALALLIARELGGQVRTVSGPIDTGAALMMLVDLEDRDTLFIDEAHRLVEGGKGKSEWLLNYLQDGVVLTPFGAEKVAQVTVVAATTDAGKLPEPLLSRFPLRPPLTGYSEQEAAKIAAVLARKIMVDLPAPSSRNCLDLARAGNNNPRGIRRLLITLRDVAIVDSRVWDGKHYDITDVLTYQGITQDGLDETAQKYLKVLAFELNTRAGERAIRDRLNEPGGLRATEQILMEKGLIGRTTGGRMLTGAGIRRAKELAS